MFKLYKTGIFIQKISLTLLLISALLLSFFFSGASLLNNNFKAAQAAGAALDSTFANNTGTGFSSSVDTSAIESDGKILLGGNFTSFNAVSAGRIVRLNSDGTLDTTFNANAGTGFNSSVTSISLQSDGKILVGGQFSAFNGTAVNYIARLNSSGTLDTAFTTGNGTSFNSYVNTIAVQSDGKILLGGQFSTFNGTSVGYIIRLNNDGTQDTNFTTGTGLNNYPFAIAIQNDGKIVIGGSFSGYNGTTSVGITRINTSGAIDSSFVTGIGSGFNNNVLSLALQSDGKIIAGGAFTSFNGTTNNYIVRINVGGTIDSAFTTTIGTGFNATVRAVSVQVDDKIVAGGNFTTFNGGTIGRIIKFNAAGTMDSNFSSKIGTGFNGAVSTIISQPDNKLVAGGAFTAFDGMTVGTSIARVSPFTVGDAAKIVIGRVETGSNVDISVCIESTSGSFRLGDTSTWLAFDPTLLSTTTTMQKTGKWSLGNGYSATTFEDVAQAPGFTTDYWSLKTVFTGDGVTTGQQGLTVSTSRPELIGKVRFNKLSGGSPAVNLGPSDFYSLENPSVRMTTSVSNVNYDCNSSPIYQSNIANSSNCVSSLSITIPNTYSCTFALVGNSDNDYTLVSSPITAYTGTTSSALGTLAGSASDDCTVSGNTTATPTLVCANIKTTGAAVGIVNVIMTIAGSGATDVGDINIVAAASTLNLKVFLTGAYNLSLSEMRTSLNTAGIVPTNQPYSVSPFNYAGSETIGGTIGVNVVDWVLVEVRSTSGVLVEQKAALILKDGTIVNPSTQSGGVQLTSVTTANYNIIVRHRNHLAISTSSPVSLSSGSATTVDYTTNSNVLGSNQTLLATGIYGMKRGNTSGDSSIDATDRVQTRTGVESYNIYDKKDLNLDGFVDASDRAIVRNTSDATDGI